MDNLMDTCFLLYTLHLEILYAFVVAWLFVFSMYASDAIREAAAATAAAY